jgi:hypothetical protein
MDGSNIEVSQIDTEDRKLVLSCAGFDEIAELDA